MPRRERAEDLGVLYCKLLEINEKFYDINEILPWTRAKDACDMFEKLEDDEKSELIHKVAYFIGSLEQQMLECLSIARGDEE